MTPSSWREWLRPQDVIWLLLFLAMAKISVAPHPMELPLLLALAILQVLEPKVPYFASPTGTATAALLKLAISYLLIGFTGGVTSSYYLLLVLPLMSASVAFGPIGTILFTLLAGGAYLSFLAMIDWRRYRLDTDQQHELVLRLLVFVAIGYLANTLAASSREQSRMYRSVAEQLATANQSLRAAEAAVRRSDRLAALGQLSAGLAHELRNPLGTIRASAEVLSRAVGGSNETAAEMAGFISTEVDRTNQLITRFLDFARPLELTLADADITTVLDRAIANYEHAETKRKIAIYRNYAPEIPPFPMDADLMERVFFNLILNAAQATTEGGEITIKTRPADGTVEVSVIDRGSGVAPEHLENIFNPFFTTKKEGVGLGLAIVSKIIDEHGGRITVESQPERGSIFRVYLPGKTFSGKILSETV